MLQRCAGELNRLAPEDPAARKANDALAASCPPARFWGGWVALGAAAFLTLGDALRRFARRRPGRRLAMTTAFFLGSSLSLRRLHPPRGPTPRPPDVRA